MRIVFLGPTYPLRGGIARYGTCLLGALQQRHDCLGIGFKKLYPSWLFPGKGELEQGDMPDSGAQAQALLHYGMPGTWRQALRQIKEFSPSCVVLTWWVTFWALHLGWLARNLASVCPVIFLCHNILPHEARFCDPQLTHWALRIARGYIVHSEENLRQLSEWFPGGRVIRRDHPVYFSDARFSLSREEARKRLGIAARMILFFGFVRPYKGLDVAIEALSLLGLDFQDLTLWVSGEFWEGEERYHRLADQLGVADRVRIESGYLPDEDLALRISACDGVVLPYRTATGSGVLATAYALNRPVIATRTGCLQDMVIPGRTGLLCNPGDARSLADAISDFYASEGPQRFAGGIEEANRRFTWDAIVDAIEELAGDG